MTFLTPAANKRKSKMVSVRIDEDLLAQFQEAAAKAEAAGYELSMTTLVHNAIRMALSEVAAVKVEATST
jgi:antitoxin component of RelBE/YafQ-DinJ toxin-antitoxin module